MKQQWQKDHLCELESAVTGKVDSTESEMAARLKLLLNNIPFIIINKFQDIVI